MSIQPDRRKEAARWFAAMRRGLGSVGECEAFEAWRRDPENHAAFASIEATWSALGIASETLQETPAAASSPPLWRMRSLRAPIAAMVAFTALALGLLLPPEIRGGGDAGSAETGIGEQRSLTLSDGSVIHLNVATQLRYRITDTGRQIELAFGQAEFVVAKDPERPFVVRAGARRIVAVGTRFDVLARDQQVGVSVREGVVAVSTVDPVPGAPWPADATMLRQGEMVTAAGGVELAAVRLVPPERIGEWRDRVLNYERATIKDVVRDLSLYFPDRVVIENPRLAERRVTLRLEVTDRDDTLNTMAKLLSLSITRRGNVLTLSGPPGTG